MDQTTGDEYQPAGKDVVHPLGNTATEDQLPHQDEQRNGYQDEVGAAFPGPVPHDVPEVGIGDIEEFHEDERGCAQRSGHVQAAHEESAHHRERCCDSHRLYPSPAALIPR